MLIFSVLFHILLHGDFIRRRDRRQKLLRRGSRLRWASLGLARRPRRLGQGTAEDLPQSIAVHRRPYTARKLRQTSRMTTRGFLGFQRL